MRRDVEDAALERATAHDVVTRLLAAATSDAMRYSETVAILMWLAGFGSRDMARVMVAYEGSRRERDGVSRWQAQVALKSAKAKVADLTGLPIPVDMTTLDNEKHEQAGRKQARRSARR